MMNLSAPQIGYLMTDSFRPLRPDVAGLRPVGSHLLHAEWFESDLEDGAADPVLLLSEAEAPSSRWPDELVSRLVATVGPVLRFDTRDAGRSDRVDAAFALDDLAVDARALLHGFGADRAHVVGRSMGGMVAQLLALDHPSVVRSLTLVSTTGGHDDALPEPAEWLVEKMAARHLGLPPVDDAGRVEWIVEQWEWFAGARVPFDRAAATVRATVELPWWQPTSGHGLAVVEAEPRWDRLGGIVAPTIVVHGTADPVHPPEHALRLVESIPGAQLELIEGLGHELPDELSAQVAGLIARVAQGA